MSCILLLSHKDEFQSVLFLRRAWGLRSCLMYGLKARVKLKLYYNSQRNWSKRKVK